MRFLASEDGRCLLNRPHMNVSYRAPVCGNNIVEPGEECDCGSSWVSRQPQAQNGDKIGEKGCKGTSGGHHRSRSLTLAWIALLASLGCFSHLCNQKRV